MGITSDEQFLELVEALLKEEHEIAMDFQRAGVCTVPVGRGHCQVSVDDDGAVLVDGAGVQPPPRDDLGAVRKRPVSVEFGDPLEEGLYVDDGFVPEVCGLKEFKRAFTKGLLFGGEVWGVP